jgi:ATP-dependent RNA helicase RhlE
MSFNSLDYRALLKAISKVHNTISNTTKANSTNFRRKDVLASAQTGTGKTAGFTLPILQTLSQGKHLSLNLFVP